MFKNLYVRARKKEPIKDPAKETAAKCWGIKKNRKFQ